MATTRDPRLPDSIRIDDIASGRVEPDLIFAELERLKVEISILRNDMSLFVQALATIPTNQSQQDYYKTVVLRLQSIKKSIHEYCEEYHKLLPIINLAQIKLGHEVEVVPNASPVKKEQPHKPFEGSSGQPIVL